MPRPLVLSSLTALGLWAGCLSPWNTRFPRLHTESAEVQRRESLLKDPFPDETLGPPTDFRPPGYEQPRTDPLRARQRYRSTILQQQYGPPPGPQIGPGAQYPQAVPID
jgi:hypothetical protein